MCFLVSTFFLVSALGGLSRGGPQPAQDWERADATVVRLKPAAFSELSAEVRQDLERRGCVVPQTFSTKAPHNVVRGRFTSAAQVDIAVLCSKERFSSIPVFRAGSTAVLRSKERFSSILVFRAGSTAAVAEFAKRPDANFLEVVASGGLVGFSRALGVANSKYIQEHYERYGGPKPPPLDHDGINDIFIEKASVVWYWYGGRWLQLQGAD